MPPFGVFLTPLGWKLYSGRTAENFRQIPLLYMSFITYEEHPMGKLSDAVTRTLAEAGEGLEALQEEVIEAGFDPDDPASVQAAIQHVEDTIDAKVARFRGNALVREAADQIKTECRADILQQVEAAGTNRGTPTVP